MSTDFIFRIIGMVVFAIIGAYTGIFLGGSSIEAQQGYGGILSMLGAVLGLILTPYITTRPLKAVRTVLLRVSAQTLAAGLVGLIVGLVIAALLSFPLSLLPSPPLYTFTLQSVCSSVESFDILGHGEIVRMYIRKSD